MGLNMFLVSWLRKGIEDRSVRMMWVNDIIGVIEIVLPILTSESLFCISDLQRTIGTSCSAAFAHLR